VTIHVACPCGNRFSVRPELAGKTINCLLCGGVVTVPAPQAADATAADERWSLENVLSECLTRDEVSHREPTADAGPPRQERSQPMPPASPSPLGKPSQARQMPAVLDRHDVSESFLWPLLKFLTFLFLALAVAVVFITIKGRTPSSPPAKLTRQEGIDIRRLAAEALGSRFEFVRVSTEGPDVLISMNSDLRRAPSDANPVMEEYYQSHEQLENVLRSRSARVLKSVSQVPALWIAKGIVVETRLGVSGPATAPPTPHKPYFPGGSVALYAICLPGEKLAENDVSSMSDAGILELCEVRVNRISELRVRKEYVPAGRRFR